MQNKIECCTADEFLFIERCYALTDFHIKEYPILKKYDYNKVFNAIAILELNRLEEEQKFDASIDFNDEIIEIEEVGELCMLSENEFDEIYEFKNNEVAL